MLLRRLAAMSAALITSAALVPAVAHAGARTSSGGTLYVDNKSGSNCSDTLNLGTPTEPYCTIQAAVNAVNPGQTVLIATGTYAPATITRSGTATAPIGIMGDVLPPTTAIQYTWIEPTSTTSSGAALTVSGASYLDISHVGIQPGATGGLVISHGSHITLDRATLQGGAYDTTAPMIDITGASSAVTIGRSHMLSAPATGIQIEGGSTGTVITTDIISGGRSGSVVAVNGASSTDVVSDDMAADCQTAVQMAQANPQTVIENDLISQQVSQTCQTPPPLVSVDSAAAPTTTDDYNTFMTSPTDYSWSGVSYLTPAQFAAATGQGAHDLVYSDPPTTIIDSANSAAPGELPTDVEDDTRVDDPLVANTGAGPITYVDRGAYEYPEPLSVSNYYASALQAPTGGAVTFTIKASSAWTSSLTYAFDFGDGSTQTNTTGVATHTYTTTGAYTTRVIVTGSTGIPLARTYSSIQIVPPAPLTAAMSLASTGSMTAVATQLSTGAWNITGYTVDFGDGTTPIPAAPSTPKLIHSYTKLGTYTIKLTSTDSDGNTASTSQQFTTAGSEYTAYGPVRVLDTRHGTGTGGVVAKVGPNQTLHLKIAGNGGIPADVSAVVFNLTVTHPSAGGDLVAFPDGESMPATSNLNFTAGQTKATNVVVGVGADGDVNLYNGSAGTVDLVADVNGYFTPAEANRYTPTHPTRVLDTRHGTGTGGVIAKLGAGKSLTLTISGTQSAPVSASGVAAVVLNLTAVDEATNGYVTAYPDGSTMPLASSLNFGAGQTVPNTVIVPVGADGKINLYNGSAGPIDLVADLEGYFSASSADAYVPAAPQRLFDSRASNGGGFYSGGWSSIDLQPLGENPEINFALSTVAYVYNVTVTQTIGSGYVTVFPSDEGLPLASNVNFTASNQTTSNTAITAGSTYGADDQFAVTFTQPGSGTQLVVDLFGYFSAQ